MIKAEIITDASIYRFDITGFEDLVAAHEFVGKELLHPDAAEFSGPDTILTIDLVASKVKSYRVWREESNPLAHLAGIAGPPPIMDESDPWEFSAGVNILGRKTTVKGLATERNGKTFYMPLTVNMRDSQGDIPALEAMGIDTLRVTFGAYLAGTGLPSEAVVPPFTLLGTEAAAFLMDVAQQSEPDPEVPGEQTARAAGSVFTE